MSAARSNIGGRFVGRSRLHPWPVPGWFQASTRRNTPGPGGWCGVGGCATAALGPSGSGFRGAQSGPGYPPLGLALRPSLGTSSRVSAQ